MCETIYDIYKTPTIMISRQHGDFLAFFSEQVSLFSEAISLLQAPTNENV